MIDGKIEKIEVHKYERFSCDIWVASVNHDGDGGISNGNNGG